MKTTLSLGKSQANGVYSAYMAHPPVWLQGTLWSAKVQTMDMEKDKAYIIHQVLAYGTLAEMLWVLHTYSQEVIRRVFTTVPYKDYRPARFLFIKNYFLGIQGIPMDERRYVKNIPRDIQS